MGMLVSDTLTVEVLLERAADFMERRRELKEGSRNYDGYSFDYHFRNEIDAMHDAAESFQTALDDYCTALFTRLLAGQAGTGD